MGLFHGQRRAISSCVVWAFALTNAAPSANEANNASDPATYNVFQSLFSVLKNWFPSADSSVALDFILLYTIGCDISRESSHTPESVAYIKRLVRNATETPLAQGLALERNLFLKLCITEPALARMRSYEEENITSPSRSIVVEQGA